MLASRITWASPFCLPLALLALHILPRRWQVKHQHPPPHTNKHPPPPPNPSPPPPPTPNNQKERPLSENRSFSLSFFLFSSFLGELVIRKGRDEFYSGLDQKRESRDLTLSGTQVLCTCTWRGCVVVLFSFVLPVLQAPPSLRKRILYSSLPHCNPSGPFTYLFFFSAPPFLPISHCDR